MRFLETHPTVRLVNNKFSYCMFLVSGVQNTDLTETHTITFLCSVSSTHSFSQEIPFVGYCRRKTQILFMPSPPHISLSLPHTIQTHPNPTLLLSPLAWHKREQSFPTHHLEREKIKKTQKAASLCSGEKTHSVTAAIRSEITAGTHGPSRLWILRASNHWWVYVVA